MRILPAILFALAAFFCALAITSSGARTLALNSVATAAFLFVATSNIRKPRHDNEPIYPHDQP